MAPTARTAYGITYYAYSLHDWRALRSLADIPRDHWPILQRTGNYEPRNRIDYRDGAVPQLGGVDHIGAGFQDDNPTDLGAENLTAYGLNPANTRASWNAAGDSNTICLLAPPDTRPWQHGVTGAPYDLNSWGIGYEDGIQSTNWDALPEPKRTAHLRMRAAFWALFFGDPDLGWELKYTDTPDAVWWHIANGRSWGLTQHGIMDPANRTDAGLVYRDGRRVNTFPYDEMLPMIREEMAIRTGGGTTPDLPAPSEDVKALQTVLNRYGNNLDVDGSYGPLTQTAAQEAADLTDYTGDVTDVAALTAHLEETAMSLLSDLPNAILNAPFPLSALSRKAGITAGTVADVLDLTMRRALGAWTYSHQARTTAQATADRLAGLEATLTTLAAATPGVDADEVARQIAERVGQYELTLSRAATPEEVA